MSSAALPVLRTPRLKLRPLLMSDADAIVHGVGNFDVSKWLSVVPYPYSRGDATNFISEVLESEKPVWAIEYEGALVGIVATDTELGYWLARSVWRKGLGFEAAHAAIQHWFADSSAGPLESSYFAGNDRSFEVLKSLGFRETGAERRNAVALSQTVDAHRMILTRKNWDSRQAFIVETNRLRLRPSRLDDARDLARISVPDVTRNMAHIVTGWSAEEARNFLKPRLWRGLLGVGLAIELDGKWIGSIGYGGSPVSLAYMIDPDYWGQGIASEALTGFLPAVFERFPVSRVVAEHFEDNPASGSVLRKLGFKKIGREMAMPKGRLEAAPVITYALHRDSLKASL